jgi:hypothetical protein
MNDRNMHAIPSFGLYVTMPISSIIPSQKLIWIFTGHLAKRKSATVDRSVGDGRWKG